MPRVDFSKVPDGVVPGDTVPNGVYKAKITGIVPGQTRNGEKWDVYSEIVEGPEAGKRIKDQWLWYGKGESRTKVCIDRLGLLYEGDAVYLPEHFIDCPIYLDVSNETREFDGKEISECRPRYAGYDRDEDRAWTPESAPEAAKDTTMFGDSSPF